MNQAEANQHDEKLIDQIVREVLSRLNGQAATAGKASPASVSLLEPVVSLAELDGRLDGASGVILARGAIVTPAARDLLRQRKINVSYDATPVRQMRRTLVVGVAQTTYEAAALVRAAAKWGADVERLANTGLTSVVDELADAVVLGGRLGLLLTQAVETAGCLANRRPGVRAVQAADRNSVARAVVNVGVNLLIVDPAGKSAFQLQQAVQEFVRGGARLCPQELRERLG